MLRRNLLLPFLFIHAKRWYAFHSTAEIWYAFHSTAKGWYMVGSEQQEATPLLPRKGSTAGAHRFVRGESERRDAPTKRATLRFPRAFFVSDAPEGRVPTVRVEGRREYTYSKYNLCTFLCFFTCYFYILYASSSSSDRSLVVPSGQHFTLILHSPLTRFPGP